MSGIYGRRTRGADHLVVSTRKRAGKLPADTPDLAAVTDADGRVADSLADDRANLVAIWLRFGKSRRPKGASERVRS